MKDKEEFFLCEAVRNKIRFEEIFHNDRPVHIEIGCGRGEFIVEIALLEPDRNFLGLELKHKRIVTMLKKLDMEKHSNVRLMKVKVDEEFLKMIESGSVERIYIFHPDPWPKRKHFKNRLIQNGFLVSLFKILQDEGEVLVTTDHEEYMKWIVKHFRDNDRFTSFYPEGFSREPFDGHIETHFEQKLKKKGYPPYYMRFIKR
ncbi:MAG: tRNA (guanosine(46)-N7)-methyltransferase TrmB [Candidatus Cloacimonetes bacterium]|nr:tRNA (guanosine(46)-N7)-methyltransferase TrmB [Candidatus Cloacimonadota bacterium]